MFNMLFLAIMLGLGLVALLITTDHMRDNLKWSYKRTILSTLPLWIVWVVLFIFFLTY